MAQFHRHSTGLLHYMHIAYMLRRLYARYMYAWTHAAIYAHTLDYYSSVVVHSQKIAWSACRIERANFVTYKSRSHYFFFFFFWWKTNGIQCTWFEFIRIDLTTNLTYHWSKLAARILWFGWVYQSKRCLLIKSSRVTITRDMLFPQHARHFTRLIDAACIVIRVLFQSGLFEYCKLDQIHPKNQINFWTFLSHSR